MTIYIPTPKESVYFSAEAKRTVNNDVMAVVFDTGDVLMVRHTELKVTCHPSAEYCDAWLCPFKFGSWTFDGSSIALQPHA